MNIRQPVEDFYTFALLNYTIMTVEIQEISKRYGSREVVRELSFTLDKGEIVGFLGPNGAGKSTTLKMLAGCIAPDRGSIRIAGFDMKKQAIEAKSRLGFLPEENPLYGEMYIAEYLEYVAGIYGLRHKQERIEEVIRQTGLQQELNKKIRCLSKGYKQRLGIAQAIIHHPDLLLLDEPASGLDPNQTEEFNALLLNLSREKAILFSSHTLSEVAAVCTRVLLIHQGEIRIDRSIREIDNLETLFKDATKAV
jgi:ABC-2 type transport system ATP-binding protein